VILSLEKTHVFLVFFLAYLYLCTQIHINMTEVQKKYRLTSMEEPTDEMLQALMEDVAKAAKESSAKAEAEKQRRFSEVARIIKARRSQRKKILDD
jgi:exopolysaccharide biosynthesis protein